MDVLPISDYQSAKRERDAKLCAEYRRLIDLKTPSSIAVKNVQERSFEICGTQIHAFETIYRIIRNAKDAKEKALKKSRQSA